MYQKIMDPPFDVAHGYMSCRSGRASATSCARTTWSRRCHTMWRADEAFG